MTLQPPLGDCPKQISGGRVVDVVVVTVVDVVVVVVEVVVVSWLSHITFEFAS